MILQEINHQGCNSGACHAQMYIMGTILRHGSRGAEAALSAAIAAGDLRLQAFGVTEPDAGSNTLALRTRAERRPTAAGSSTARRSGRAGSPIPTSCCCSRARPRPPTDERRTGGLSTFLVDLREAGGSIEARPIRTLMNHATVELFIKDLELPRTPSSARRARASPTSSTA